MIYFIVQDCSLLFHYFTRVQCSFQARYMIVLNKVCEDSLLKIYHSFLLIHCRIYSSSVLCTYKCIYNEKWYDKYICYYDLLRISGWSFSKTIIYFIRSIYIYIYLMHCFPFCVNGNVRVAVIIVSKSLEQQHFGIISRNIRPEW